MGARDHGKEEWQSTTLCDMGARVLQRSRSDQRWTFSVAVFGRALGLQVRPALLCIALRLWPGTPRQQLGGAALSDGSGPFRGTPQRCLTRRVVVQSARRNFRASPTSGSLRASAIGIAAMLQTTRQLSKCALIALRAHHSLCSVLAG